MWLDLKIFIYQLLLIYIFIIIIATLKNAKTEQVSTIVVISGAAITAGSNFNFLAIIGSVHPKYFRYYNC